MSLPSTSNRCLGAPTPAVVGHLVANAGCRARVLPSTAPRMSRPRRQVSVQAVQQEESVDLDTSVDAVKKKLIDAAGAGKSFTSPGWLTQLGRLWGGKSDTPVADAKPDDIKDCWVALCSKRYSNGCRSQALSTSSLQGLPAVSW